MKWSESIYISIASKASNLLRSNAIQLSSLNILVPALDFSHVVTQYMMAS